MLFFLTELFFDASFSIGKRKRPASGDLPTSYVVLLYTFTSSLAYENVPPSVFLDKLAAAVPFMDRSYPELRTDLACELGVENAG